MAFHKRLRDAWGSEGCRVFNPHDLDNLGFGSPEVAICVFGTETGRKTLRWLVCKTQVGIRESGGNKGIKWD